jgi:hypothetical protein
VVLLDVSDDRVAGQPLRGLLAHRDREAFDGVPVHVPHRAAVRAGKPGGRRIDGASLGGAALEHHEVAVFDRTGGVGVQDRAVFRRGAGDASAGQSTNQHRDAQNRTTAGKGLAPHVNSHNCTPPSSLAPPWPNSAFRAHSKDTHTERAARKATEPNRQQSMTYLAR